MDKYYRKFFYRGDKCIECNREITIRASNKKCRACSKKGNTNSVGRILSEDHKRKISESNSASGNGMWKGSSVGYTALHTWVKRHLIKPKMCSDCKIKPPYDLANKGTYDRNLENWEWLCRSCHMKKDGRLKILLKRNVIKK